MSAQPELVPSQPARRVRLGFLGLGWIGRQRLDAVAGSAGIEVAALVDSASDRAQAAADRYPEAVVARDLEGLLSCGVDGVVIATPNACHAEQTLACLDRGVAVFCQKPLAIDGRTTADVIAAARAANRLLGVDFCYRHVQGMDELRRRLADGELGQLLSIDLQFHNAYGPDKAWCHDRRLSGGGCVLDLGVHLLDLALWLQNAPRMELVSSQLFERGRRVHGRDGAIEDVAIVELRQTDDAVVRLACSWNAHIGRGAAIGMRLLGTKGGAYWRNVDGSFYDFQLDLTRGDTSQQLATAPDDWGGRALAAWAERLQGDRSFDASIELTARGAALIDEIYRA
jgi:predicted dehydrogenase